MPIPAEGYPLTAAVSPRVQVVEKTDSTNADVLHHLKEESAEWPHLSVVLTTDQRHGRGRMDRSWTAPPETALAVSVVLRVRDLPVTARGWIPLLAGAAMTRAVAAQMPSDTHAVGLKWPNDVQVDGGKICGILAEVAHSDPDAVVVGAGVNTRMAAVDLPVSTATSFEAIGLECDDDRLLADFLRDLDEQVQALTKAGGSAAGASLHEKIEELCTTIGSRVRVALPDGSALEGVATRLDTDGRLLVQRDDGSATAVSAGDVVHVR